MRKQRFLAETIRNFGVGLMVGSVLLRIAERVSDFTLLIILAAGLLNIGLALILLPEE